MYIPFLARENVSAVVVSGQANKKSVGILEDMGIAVIKTTRVSHLYDSIAYHPDIVIHPIQRHRVIVAHNIDESLKDSLRACGIDFIVGDTFLKRNYPFNIAYNVARIGETAFHNVKYTDPVIKKCYFKDGIRLIHVNQGYGKCSVVPVDQNAFITSDMGLKKAGYRAGLDVLLIRPGHIKLEGMPYGFIGGTCGFIKRDVIAFYGDVYSHPDGDSIIKFLHKYGIKASIIHKGPLEDIGSIIPL